ncbi:hypothetical protein [Rhodococcus sp. SGAir0479]|uniref:hypothetical protein n=1 Tax=Rhodococcus sp. SGAir0479 TaxID=2567884 RepID=UPI00268960AC
MTDLTIDGFDYHRIPGEDGVELNVAVGGSGDPWYSCTVFRRPTSCGGTWPGGWPIGIS